MEDVSPTTNSGKQESAVERVESVEEQVEMIVEGIASIANGCAAVSLTNFTDSAEKSAHNAALVEKWKHQLAKRILTLIENRP